jgi:hypothetical protein
MDSPTRADDPILVPHPERFAPHEPGYGPAVAAHAAAVTAGQDGYLDPSTGYFVFTASYLRDRGDCCEVGCRHCPWLDVD